MLTQFKQFVQAGLQGQEKGNSRSSDMDKGETPGVGL